MLDSEKIAIAIEKMLPEYQGVLTSKMSKEGRSITPRNIEDVAFFSTGEQYMDHTQRMLSLMYKQMRKQTTKE